MSAFINGIKINNLQHQLKALSLEVDALQVITGATGISGDLSLNGHNLLQVGALYLSEGVNSHTLTMTGADLTIDNNVVLDDTNYASHITGFLANPAGETLNMAQKNIDGVGILYVGQI